LIDVITQKTLKGGVSHVYEGHSNHLGLGWNTPAVNQITAWLGAP
jgi:hypothetical protein